MPKKSAKELDAADLLDEREKARIAQRENIIEALRHARRGGHLNTADIDAILDYIGAPE